jgi:hypothetical protein
MRHPLRAYCLPQCPHQMTMIAIPMTMCFRLNRFDSIRGERATRISEHVKKHSEPRRGFRQKALWIDLWNWWHSRCRSTVLLGFGSHRSELLADGSARFQTRCANMFPFLEGQQPLDVVKMQSQDTLLYCKSIPFWSALKQQGQLLQWGLGKPPS